MSIDKNANWSQHFGGVLLLDHSRCDQEEHGTTSNCFSRVRKGKYTDKIKHLRDFLCRLSGGDAEIEVNFCKVTKSIFLLLGLLISKYTKLSFLCISSTFSGTIQRIWTHWSGMLTCRFGRTPMTLKPILVS